MDTERNGEFLEIIKTKLTPQRLYHSICVAEQAERLAKIYHSDPKKAYTAGLVHDIMKYETPEKMIEMIENDGTRMTESEKKMTPILHAIAGEVYLRNELSVTDKDILSAVKYHTTGKENMTLFEKILYVADLTSDERDYPDVDEMRQLAIKDIDKAVLKGLSFTIEKNSRICRPIHLDTVKAFNYLAERTN